MGKEVKTNAMRILDKNKIPYEISGSFHLTPGQAYHVADNGNQSRIHWDMVCIQTEAAGGGDIYLDGKLVRRNGLFTLPELAILNPSLS